MQNSVLVWLTSRPPQRANGVARDLRTALIRQGHSVLWVDGDELRSLIGETRAAEGRDRFSGIVTFITNSARASPILVLVSSVGLSRAWRDQLRCGSGPLFHIGLEDDTSPPTIGGWSRRDDDPETEDGGIMADYDLALRASQRSDADLVDAILRWLNGQNVLNRFQVAC